MDFYNDPPKDLLTLPLPVVRPKPGKVLSVLFLSQSWVGVYTHWWGGKTVPHEEVECKACDRSVPKIWKGFIPVCDALDRDRRALLQITPRVVARLRESASAKTGLIGVKAVFERVGSLANSPLRVTCFGCEPVPTVYSDERVARIVCALFSNRVRNDE